MENISAHTSMLVRRLYQGMKGMRFNNGHPLCKIYHSGDEDLLENGRGDEVYGDARVQGATVAFNVFREDGTYEGYAMVEKMANDRGIYVRSGGASAFYLLDFHSFPMCWVTDIGSRHRRL